MSVKSVTGLFLVVSLLLTTLIVADAGAQPAPDPKKPAQDPKAPAGPPDKPVAPGERDPHDVDFSIIKFSLKENRFGYHLRDLDDKEGSSADLYGRVVLIYSIYLASNSANTDEYQRIKGWFEAHRGQANLICILITEPERENAHIRKAKEFVKAHNLPGDRFFVSNRQILDQVKEKSAGPPYFIFLGRDGHVEVSVNRWFKRFGDRAEPVLNRLLGAAAPAGPRPDPPALEEVKAPEFRKDPDRVSGPDEG